VTQNSGKLLVQMVATAPVTTMVTGVDLCEFRTKQKYLGRVEYPEQYDDQ
jgi:hypothetical protein